MASTFDGASAGAEVSWQIDDTTVYGTLLQPAGAGPFPAVVMIAGSGPTDRDWTSPLLSGDNGSARLLAEELARAGIASLRFDKRASGPHAAENMAALVGKVSLQSHADEVTGAVRTLTEKGNVDPARIFAFTNSEGAIHGLYYQLHAPAVPFAGLVLTAPPGRVMGAVARAQVAAQMAALPDGAQILAAYDAAIARFLAGQPTNPDPSLPPMVGMLLQALDTPFNLPFTRELWAVDTAAWLAEVKVPVLVVIGKKDIQVDWQADGEPLRQAAQGREDVTFIFPENANHVLKHEPRPRAELDPGSVVAGYNAPESKLDPEALVGILGWLKERAGV